MSLKALIVGAGSGVSASFARALARQGADIALAARNIDKLDALKQEIDAIAIACDATEADQVANLFKQVDKSIGTPDLVLYNASAFTAGPVAELESAGSGAIFFTGATASIKGFPGYAPFAMGKFALRGLTQSLARELGPQNIHIAHFIIDGSIASPGRSLGSANPSSNADDAMLEPDAIAEVYLSVLNQHRSAWSLEIDLRPWKETF